MDHAFSKALDFINNNGRLLERSILAAKYLGADASSVLALVRKFQNKDGGLGHALEPDLRTLSSQPIFVEYGLTCLHTVQLKSSELATEVISFLKTVSSDTGLLPAITAKALDSDHAEHWNFEDAQNPRLNPTLGICGLAHYHGCSDPWLSKATDTCVDVFRKSPPLEAHTLLGASFLARYIPDKGCSDELLSIIQKSLPGAEWFAGSSPTEDYALTPLHFAPHPKNPLNAIFPDTVIDLFLDDLLAKQDEDGGWPISWKPPSGSASQEWRAIVTLKALEPLVNYGKIHV